jgi:hypothetical protein
MFMRAIAITAKIVVILASTSWFVAAEEPGPSAAPSPPAVLAQSPPGGVIEAATPVPTPAASPSPAATSALQQAAAAASPSVEPSPAVANASAMAVPAPASTFNSQLLGGKEPELDEEERAGVEVTNAWRQRSYESMVSQAGTSGSVLFRYDQSYPSIVCAILQVKTSSLSQGKL